MMHPGVHISKLKKRLLQSLKAVLLFVAVAAMAAAVAFPAEARRTSDRVGKTTRGKVARQQGAWQKGTIALSAANADSLALSVDSVHFAGFDKPSSSDKESFFITNRLPKTIAGLTLEITYLTPEGRLLHRRVLTQRCYVPAGETRKLDVRSFDTQGAYHYYLSSPGRSGATPFKVSFRPLTLFVYP